MNTLELKSLLACVKRLQVCASDRLYFDELPFYAIINSENSMSDGLHWLGLAFVNQDSQIVCYYFDSLGGGMLTMVKSIKDFVLKHADKIVLNKYRIQQLTSSVCGLYAASFILNISSNTPFERFLKEFGRNDKENDLQIYKKFHDVISAMEKRSSTSDYQVCKALKDTR
jgi:hypothetical protein